MGSELCKTCIHTKVCMKDKNLIGDVFVMGHPMLFDNDKLYEQYKEREKEGFPCDDYTPTAEPERNKGRLINPTPYGECSECGYLIDSREGYNFCPNCGARMDGDTNG